MMKEWPAGDGFHSILAPLSLNTTLCCYKKEEIFARTRSNPELQWRIRSNKQHYLLQQAASSSSRMTLSPPMQKRSKRRATTSITPRRGSGSAASHQHDYSSPTTSIDHTSNPNARKRQRQSGVMHCALDEIRSSPIITTTNSVSPRQEVTSRAPIRREPSESRVDRNLGCPSPTFSEASFPSSPLSRSSSFKSQASACSHPSPLTSLCDRIEEHADTLQPSSDCDYIGMAEAGSSRASPLAYKRKGSTTSLGSQSVKKRRQDEVSPTKSDRRSRNVLVPEVVINQRSVSPWSKEWKSGSLPMASRGAKTTYSETIDLCSTDEDDDDITLLPTKRSISEHAARSQLNRSSSVRQSSPDLCSSPLAPPRSSPSTHRTPHRNAIEKLTSLMEDIFEAETDISSGDGATTISSLSKHAKAFFTRQDGLPPVLKSEKISLLVRLAHACPSSRDMTTDVAEADGQTPRRWSQMDPQEISRLIKIMHRGLDLAAGLNPFPILDVDGRSPTKKKRVTRKKDVQAEEEDAPLLSHATLEEMKSKLSRIAYSATVADSCLSILSNEGTNKVLLCEEMILPCLQFIKTALDNLIIPFAEACGETSSCSNPLLDELVGALGSSEATIKDKTPKQSTLSLVSACADQIGITFTCLISSLPRLQAMLKKPDLILSETMAFVLADSLLPAFFVLDPEATSSSSSEKESIKMAALASLCGSNTPMKSLRLSAIHVLRLIYERTEEQKEYIVTTILDKMQSLQDTRKQARRQHGLTNGKAICSSTALLLQIIQASSQPVAKAKKVQDLMDWDEGSASPHPEEPAVQSDVFKLDMLREGQDMARKAAKDMAQCLMHKVTSVGQAKATKNAAPSELGFATVMDSLVSDLLDTLSCPEWPASSLLLSQLCVHFCTYLDDDNGNQEVRSIALDQLGLMAKKWSESKLQSQCGSPILHSVATILESRDISALEQLNRAYWSVIQSLKQRSDGEGSMEGAARFLEAQWGREMMLLLYQSSDIVGSLPEVVDKREEAEWTAFVRRVDTLIGQMVLAADIPEQIRDLIEADDDTEALSISDSYQRLMHSFAYGGRFEAIEDQLVSASHGPNATNRNKAIRGLSLLTEVNSDILLKESVRAAVQRGLYDGSVNVRDTALGLLSKFAMSRPEHLQSILPSLKERMQDTALLIRKRALRLFRNLYDANTEEKIQVDTAVEIVGSVFDEEETMRDLAIESAAQMWFGLSNSTAGKSPVKKTSKAKAASKERDEEDNREGQDWQDDFERSKLQKRLNNIVQVANRLRVKPSPVQEVLQRMVRKSDGDELQRQMAQLVNLTIDNIVESQQSSQEPVAAEQLVEQVEVIALLVQTNPLTLSIRKAKMLLPYLRGGIRDAEIRLLRSLLAIFSRCLPIMASTASSFAKQLQSTLTPLVNKPSNHAAVLEELLKCYCTVVCTHTHDFSILIKSMQICHRQVKRIQLQGLLNEAEVRNARVLILMTSLLAESADFDTIRKEHLTFAMDIDEISSGSVSQEVADILVKFMQMPALRPCALHSLRFVCRAFPKLMTGESVGGALEEVLREGSIQDRLSVLRIVADVLEVDSAKHDPNQATPGRDKMNEKTRKVAREELAGESDSQGNPVTFEIVARYGDLIQALAVHEPLQKLTMEIIEVIVLRGICHPLQYLSTIIALQTVNTDKWISNKAQSLHRQLINKSNTSINFRQAQHAREAWQFQQTRHGIEVEGINDQREALFETWYTTIKEQKKTRMDLLKALVKSFDVDISSGACTEEDIHYARFIAENLAQLKYKTVDEVVLVASEVQNILTIAGEQVQISVQEEVPVDGEEDEDEDNNDEEGSKRAIVIGRMSTILSMALRLLMHMREQYGLKEAQIARGVDKKSSNVAAVRKGIEGTIIKLDDLPGAFNRKESMSLAKREMNVFDTMLNCEGIGGAADGYDSDD